MMDKEDVTSGSPPEFTSVGETMLAPKGAPSSLRRVFIENIIATARLPEQPHLINAMDRTLLKK